MKCYVCGHEQEDGRFCDNCGRMVTRVIVEDEDHAHEEDGDEIRPAELRCQCGHVQKSGRFCDACGLMLSFYRAQDGDDDLSYRCHQCGSQSKVAICRNCGVHIRGFPSSEE